MCTPTIQRIARLTIVILVIVIVLSSTVASINTSCLDCSVAVAPGKFDLKLGDDFPGFNSVKLSYPNSTILTNSTGDLLFSVTLTSNSSNIIAGLENSTFYNSIDIYIPPDFTGLSLSQLWTSFTNNYDHNSLSLSKVGQTDRIAPGWWDISIRNLTVTSDSVHFANRTQVAHRIFLANRTQYVRVFYAGSPVIAGRYFFKISINGTSIGPRNFPTLVVKGSRDPAYISGTLRDAGNTNSSIAGMPIQLPDGYGGRILATGYDSQGHAVSAQAFINSSANGQYTLFGVASGTYNITAYAAGFVPTTRPYRVSVHPTQSLDGIDIYLPHSVNITGTVLSIGPDGQPLPWGYDFGFGGQVPKSIVVNVLNLVGSVEAATPAPYGSILRTDPTASSFSFSVLREVGYDGRIPQDYANYTSGLTSNDYLLTASVTSYVQFDEARIHISNQTIQVHDTIRLIRTGYFNITVHFRDLNTSLVDTPVPIAGTLTVQAIDSAGVVRGSNTTFVPANSTSATLEIQGTSRSRGFGNLALLSPNGGLVPGVYHIVATLSSSPTFAGYANVGIRQLYYQLSDYSGILGWGVTELSLPIFKGGGIKLTLYSVDSETPNLYVPFAYAPSTITLKIVDSLGKVYQANATQPVGWSNETFFYSGLLTDTYTILVQTVGYTQLEVLNVKVRLGGNSDAQVLLVLGPRMDLTLAFMTENLLAPINSTAPFAQPINNIDGTPARFEVYDANDGTFVGANVTYIPNGNTTLDIELVGFRQYSGDPWNIWSGFYDTTDASQQIDSGFVQGNYILRVWVDGYYAKGLISVNLPKRGEVSLIYSMDRGSRIHGTAVGLDFYQEARPLSWAVIDVEPAAGPLNFTTTSLDGGYQLWVPAGEYRIGISLQGYNTYATNLYVAPGSDMVMDATLSG
jgi:hypothetical protein